MKKKVILSFSLAILILLSSFMLSACGSQGASKTMEISINPDISFVVDGNDKITSFNYKNNDSSILYANVDFIGMDVNNAVKIIVEIAAISGHIDYEGSVVNLQINGSVNNEIKELENKVKEQIESTFASLGVSVKVNAEQLTDEAKHGALVTCAETFCVEYTYEELNAKSNEELVEIINNKQKEYEGLAYSQISEIENNLKNIENTIFNKIQELKDKIQSAKQEVENYEKIFKDNNSELIQSQLNQSKQILNGFKDLLNSKVNDYQSKKQQLINESKAKLDSLKTEFLTNLKNQVSTHKSMVINHLDTVKEKGIITEEQYNAWIALINSYENK